MKNYLNELNREVDDKIREIELGEGNMLKQSAAAREVLSVAFSNLKEFIRGYQFRSDEEEILFFKELKPKLHCKLLYYQKINMIEMCRPTCSRIEEQKQYFMHELDRLHDSFIRSLDFVKYFRSGSTHHDSALFIRGQLCNDFPQESIDFERDPMFSTNADFKVAKLMTNDMLQVYLNSELELLNKTDSFPSDPSFPKIKLTWTGKKTYIKELVYSISLANCINGGDISLNQLFAYFGNVFNIDLSNFSRDFYDMKDRNAQTPFLDMLKGLLTEKMNAPGKSNKKRSREVIP